MGALVIIPCRYGSSRFPGKPLVAVNGHSLIQRVWRIGLAANPALGVVVATDDSRIEQHVRNFGGSVMMTDPACRNGTERAFEVARRLSPTPNIVVNLQGDALLTPPTVIAALISAMESNPSISIATPAVRLTSEQHQRMLQARGAHAGGTFVVFNKDCDALYFSKSSIPFLRDGNADIHPVYRHIGLYAYRFDALTKLVGLEPTPLEATEQLEQLRALEHGIPIRVVQVDYGKRSHWSIDRPEDVAVAEQIIQSEGELVDFT